MSKGTVIAIQGAQYGSEGKGMITAMEAGLRKPYACIRTGGPNAGHTVYHDGCPYVMNQLPTTWATSPSTALIVGAGAIISIARLEEEINFVTMIRPDITIMIDGRALVIDPEDKLSPGSKSRYDSIGGTNKGTTDAIIRKLHRCERSTLRDMMLTDAEIPECITSRVIDNIAVNLNDWLYSGKDVLIEGTQGFELDFVHGVHPWTTHRMCTPAALIAEAGISPTFNVEVGLVARTYPIRVAGESGPLPGEVLWSEILRRFGYDDEAVIFESFVADLAGVPKVDDFGFTWKLSAHRCRRFMTEVLESCHKAYPNTAAWKLIEKTSVTHLVRRIAKFDESAFLRAVLICGHSWTALTFANYIDPRHHCVPGIPRSEMFERWVVERSEILGRIKWLTTGPLPEHHTLIG